MGKIDEYRLTIDNPYTPVVKFDSGIEIIQDTKFEHENKVAPKGVICFVPEFIIENDRYGRPLQAVSGASYGLKVGDVVYIRYDVVGEGELLPDGSRYHRNAISVTDPDTNITSTKKEWFCAHDQIFAVERDGQLVMINGYAMCRQEAITTERVGLIYIPEMSKVKLTDNVAHVINIGEQTGKNKRNIKIGDRIFTQLRYAGKYNFSGMYGDDMHLVHIDSIEMKVNTVNPQDN